MALRIRLSCRAAALPAAAAHPGSGGPRHAPLGVGRDPGRGAHRRAAGRGGAGAAESLRRGRRGARRAQTGCAHMTIWETEPNAEVAARLAAQERELVRLREEGERWRRAAGAQPVRDDVEFTSVSGRAVEPVYTPLDLVSPAEL